MTKSVFRVIMTRDGESKEGTFEVPGVVSHLRFEGWLMRQIRRYHPQFPDGPRIDFTTEREVI